jgi:pimeloyl-ACP methyl ester carboxylesterase
MPHIEPITGRYLHIERAGTTYRTYFEESGEGVPLVCLHTAGADSRLYRHLLTDDEILRHHRVIAFDMPWHGRSLPPDGWETVEYQLTRRDYIDFVVAFCDALELDAPILLGCSMGGYLTLDIAHECPQRFGGLIGVQTSAFAPAWVALAGVTVDPEINFHSLMAPVHSVSAPTSPEARRREVDWIYATNGPGVIAGDFHYAGADHDARPFLGEIDATAVGLHVIAGDWDPSCLPEHTEELKRQVPGLEVTRIPTAGHFAPAENPEAFKRAVMPVLAKLRERSGTTVTA